MNVLIDTSIILDVLLQKEPFFQHSQLVLLAVEAKYINGYVTASTITDVYDVIKKSVPSKKSAIALLKTLVDTIAIAAVDSDVIINALTTGWDDFEESIKHSVAESIDADFIVTRNPADFSNGHIKTILPEALINLIASD